MNGQGLGRVHIMQNRVDAVQELKHHRVLCFPPVTGVKLAKLIHNHDQGEVDSVEGPGRD